jgi:hypothetical protein
MSLTQSDLQHIEAIFDKKLEPILGKLETLENDIKDIYIMISELQHSSVTDKAFRKKPAKERILILHAEVVAAAHELGVKLPEL